MNKPNSLFSYFPFFPLIFLFGWILAVGTLQYNVQVNIKICIQNNKQLRIGKMSHRKPNLTIQIQQLPQEFNSKFKGYVQYPNHSPQSVPYQPQYEIMASRASHKSNHSNASNMSDRSALLERAQRYMIESRLAQNVKSLCKNRFKTMSNSRTSYRNPVSQHQQDQPGYNDSKRSSVSKKELTRSKSASNINTQNSRAKILQQIADKLKDIDKQQRRQQEEQNRSYASNTRTYRQENQDGKLRVERIKQIRQQLCKTRGGKLEHLMKDIKKSNRQAYKIVYTIKKSSTGASPFEKSLQMRDKIHEQTKRNVANTIVGTNLFNTHPQQTPPLQNYSNSKHNDYSNFSNGTQLKRLAEELHNVRMQLKEVKNKNQELLNLSRMRSGSDFHKHNGDSASQSSRITRQIQALEFDIVSNGSNSINKNSPYTNFTPTVNAQSQPSFVKPQNYTYYNATNGQSYVVVRQSDMVQPCFACGCTCRNKRNMLK